MSYYAIGIGGTGTKCLESLIHLAAAGMMPNKRDLFVLFVDPDGGNGILDRAKISVKNYRECRNDFTLETDLLKTKINYLEVRADGPTIVWQPYKDTETTLTDCFSMKNIKNIKDPKDQDDDILKKNEKLRNTARLFDVLYSETERDAKLGKGFHAHPSIGAAILAQKIDFQQDNLWNTFCDSIRNDDNAKIFLAGSIFGGTGAAGLPTIAYLIGEQFDHIPLGGAFILPYFKFSSNGTSSNETNGETNELRAKSDNFLLNTKAALKYYHDQPEVVEKYDAVYLLGAGHRVEVPSAQSDKQRNIPHYIELYAALAALDFFEKSFDTPQCFVIPRNHKNQLQWSDLPGKSTSCTQIHKLARFAFAYLAYFEPTVEKIKDGTVNVNDHAWFKNFFKFKKKGILKKGVNLQEEKVGDKLANVKKYCETFLIWLARIQVNSGENENINLINYRAFAHADIINQEDKDVLKSNNDFDLRQFNNLISSDTTSIDFDSLHERLGSKISPNNASKDLDEFLKALYEHC